MIKALTLIRTHKRLIKTELIIIVISGCVVNDENNKKKTYPNTKFNFTPFLGASGRAFFIPPDAESPIVFNLFFSFGISSL